MRLLDEDRMAEASDAARQEGPGMLVVAWRVLLTALLFVAAWYVLGPR
jgi:hypothetical protein